jgi:hypothetical protein
VGVVDQLEPLDRVHHSRGQLEHHLCVDDPLVGVTPTSAWHGVCPTVSSHSIPDWEAQHPCHPDVHDGLIAPGINDGKNGVAVDLAVGYRL